MQTPHPVTFLCAVLASLTITVTAFDKGFEHLFTSNRKEFRDLVVKFDKPLPTWLNGTVFHNGLGVFEQGNRRVSHFFDAYAKFNSIKLQGGSDEGLFTYKFARTRFYNDSLELNDIAPYMLFDTPRPAFEPEQMLTQLSNGMDNVNVNLHRLGNDLVAVGDFPRVYRVDEPSLETIEMIDPKIGGVGVIASNRWLSTSHPVPEAGTDNWFNIVTEVDPFTVSKLHILRLKGAARRELVKTVNFSMIPYMHSFVATKKHIILFVNPVTMDFARMVISGAPKDALVWVEDRPTFVYVVEIATGEVQILQTEAVFGLHYANAFVSEGDVIAVDAITYPDLEVVKAQMLEDLLDPVRRNTIPTHKSHLKRYFIDLDKKSVKVHEFPSKPDTFAANWFDFPVFNELYRFNKYCYIYGVAQKMDRVNMAKWALVKKDTCDHKGDKVWYKENHYPGEPWFEARPGSTKEDDGLVMTIVLDGEKGRSYLAMFDAQSLELVNKAYLPTYLPMVLHGRFHKNL